MTTEELLYITIKDFELRERIRRSDYSFDAFGFLAAAIGHKNPSTVRKMCEPQRESNKAKLGFNDSMKIMQLTGDYRLLHFMMDEIRRHAPEEHSPADPFAKPMGLREIFREA